MLLVLPSSVPACSYVCNNPARKSPHRELGFPICRTLAQVLTDPKGQDKTGWADPINVLTCIANRPIESAMLCHGLCVIITGSITNITLLQNFNNCAHDPSPINMVSVLPRWCVCVWTPSIHPSITSPPHKSRPIQVHGITALIV